MKNFVYCFLVSLALVFTQTNCILSNLVECGSFDCKRSKNKLLAMLGLLSSNSCPLPAEGSRGGLQDDPSQYESFSGRISNSEWDETYIRKILHTFAWGGPASDAQIQEWVNMGPSKAIIEILNADPINPKLNQPVVGAIAATSSNASLFCLSSLVSSGGYLLPASRSAGYGLDDIYSSTGKLFPLVAQMKGLNPVRQVLGYMETNNHMATNSLLVGPRPQYRLYDETMNMIARGESYDKVLANGGLSAAIAIQYNHRQNRFDNGEFLGNEDFAREFHQLLFGVLGGSTTGELEQSNNTAFEQHEKVTIPETAKALTHIQVGESIKSTQTNLDLAIYGTELHLPRPVKVYGIEIGGANAKEKIYNIAKESIKHPESLQNLPLKIVRFLADDNLDEADITATNPNLTQQKIQDKANLIRTIWANLPEKNLLIFLRRYALSTAFYNETRIKYRTSAERIFTIANLVTLSNSEISWGFHGAENSLRNEDIRTFRPTHEVFGEQTGIEARDTADVFKSAYNSTSETPNQWGLGVHKQGSAVLYRKPFHLLIPRGADGKWRVKQVAEWLWNRFIGDGLKNMGNLERAHLYALLASGTDLNYFMSKDKKDPTINTISYGYGDGGTNDIANSLDFKTKVEDASVAILRLDDFGEDGDEARVGVGLAINFILSTPYMFVIEGK